MKTLKTNTQPLRNCARVLDTPIADRSRIVGRQFAGILFVFTSSFLSPMILAQQASPSPGQDDASGGRLQEIVVTASKREETLGRTPIAVTALTQEQLTTQGVTDVQTLATVAPTVEIGVNGLFGNMAISIRGISNRDPGEDANPAIATYLDGVYVPRTQGLQVGLYDLERVEVLRGPQGTLYGRSAAGGNINIITMPPHKQFEAAGDVSYGDYGDMMSHGVLNVPVTDTLAIRASFVYHRNDGYFDTGGVTARNYGASDDRGGRISALWTPNENFNWRVTMEDFVSDGTPPEALLTAPSGSPQIAAPVYRQPVNSTPDPYLHIENYSGRSKMDWKLGQNFSLSYVAGYQGLKFASASDNSNNLKVFDSFPAQKDQNTSHEVDLNYDSGRLKNLLGANYFYEDTSEYSYYYLYPSLGLATPDQNPDLTRDAWGVFDQGTFSVTSALHVTAGVRYSKETENKLGKRELFCPIDTVFYFGAYPPTCSTTYLGSSGSWSSPTWKFGIDYAVSAGTMAYIAVTRGFKAGGLNDTTKPSEAPYDPEYVMNYELGVKTHLLDDRLRLNTDIYDEEYTNLQVTQSVGPDTLTRNAAKARIYGVDVEGDWDVTAKDRLEGFVSYLHATYVNYDNAIDNYLGITDPSLDGHHLPTAPAWSARLQYSHDFDLANGASITPSVNSYWQAVSYLREFNLPIDRIPAYSKTEVRVAYVDPTARWKFEAYVYNLENKAVRTDSFVLPPNYYSFYAPPRTYGMRLSYRFP